MGLEWSNLALFPTSLEPSGRRLVTWYAVVRSRNLTLERGPGRNCFVVAEIAIDMVPDLVRQFGWRRLIRVSDCGHRRAVVPCLKMA